MDNWYVTAEEMESLRRQGCRLYIVDIRSNDRFRKRHIKGAVNMQTDEEDNMSVRNEQILEEYINAGYMVIIYCASGTSSMKCVRKLRKRNIIAYNLYGGINGLL